ncbi:MAG: hypothetical protein AAF439_08705 [Pseudomonadota bacterium]
MTSTLAAMTRRQQSLGLTFLAGLIMAAPMSIKLISTSYWGGILGLVMVLSVACAGANWVARRSGWQMPLAALLIVGLTYFAAPLPLLLVNEIQGQGFANSMTALMSGIFVAMVVAIEVLVEDALYAVFTMFLAAALILIANQRQSA